MCITILCEPKRSHVNINKPAAFLPLYIHRRSDRSIMEEAGRLGNNYQLLASILMHDWQGADRHFHDAGRQRGRRMRRTSLFLPAAVNWENFCPAGMHCRYNNTTSIINRWQLPSEWPGRYGASINRKPISSSGARKRTRRSFYLEACRGVVEYVWV